MSTEVSVTPIQQRPEKIDLARQIADILGIDPPVESTGSTIVSKFLDQVHRGLGYGGNPGTDTYRKTEAILARLGLPYDPYWDTSEHSATGGGTVTSRAYSRILAAVSQQPRAFLVPATEVRRGASGDYHYTGRLASARTLNDSGPDTRIVLVRGGVVESLGVVEYIGPDTQYRLGEQSRWWMRVVDQQAPAQPTNIDRESAGLLAGRTVEISWIDYQRLRRAAGLPYDEPTQGRGGSTVVERLLDSPPRATPALRVPNRLPSGDLGAPAVREPTYSDDGRQVAGLPTTMRPRDQEQRVADRSAEVRAVELAYVALKADGWHLVRDRQADGCGYDLHFDRDGRDLHVEVKGIQGTSLVFNLTPKERWRAETDPDFVVIAVTQVLSPLDFHLHLITRDRLLAAAWAVTGYRVGM